MEGQPARRLQMPGDCRQALSLQVDGQQMLEGPKGHEDAAEPPTEFERGHVLIDEGEPPLYRERKLGELAPRDRQHSLRQVDAGNGEPGLGQRQRNAPGAARKFQDGAAGLSRKPLVERNIAGDLRR